MSFVKVFSTKLTPERMKIFQTIGIAAISLTSCWSKKTNCLAYRYRYRPKFYNWLPLFLEKRKYRYEPKRFYSLPVVFLLLSFYFLVTLQSYVCVLLGSIFFCFSFCGTLGLLLCLKSKKHKGSDSLPSLMGNYHKSYLHAYFCQNFWVNG